MCDCTTKRLCHLHAPEPADLPRLTGRPGLVGMLNSGRSDLSVAAKAIVRGGPYAIIWHRQWGKTALREALQRSLDRRG